MEISMTYSLGKYLTFSLKDALSAHKTFIKYDPNRVKYTLEIEKKFKDMYR